MSRFALAATIILSLFSSAARADRAFAPPPPQEATHATEPDPEAMPRRPLDRAEIAKALQARRATNLATFRAYRKAAVFPSNTYQNKIINVWRDDAGHLCAVATMVNASGATELVARVADQTNFIRLGEVTTGPLMDWMLTSGFTQEEIAQIQLPDSPVFNPPAPSERPQVVAKLRAAETARLVAQFKQVDAKLVKGEKAALELAVTRLMAHPNLAWQLLD